MNFLIILLACFYFLISWSISSLNRSARLGVHIPKKQLHAFKELLLPASNRL